MGDLNVFLGADEYARLEQLYTSVTADGSYASIEAFVNECYDMGESLIDRYVSGELSITEKGFSYLLSELNDAAEFVVRLAAVCNDVPEYGAEFVSEYNRIRSILNFSDRVGVKYLSEPCEEIMDIQKKIAKYRETARINPISGENYTVSELGRITVSGTATKKSTVVSVKLSKDGEVKYLTTLDTSKKKDYEMGYNLPGFGTYTLEIYDGVKREEEIVYQKNGYVSMEDKMTSFGNIRSERLLKWSKLLMADYLENQKGFILATDVSGEGGELVLDYSNTDYEVFVAVYDADGIVSVTEKNDEGKCIIDVSELSEYTVKAYVWNDLIPKSKVVNY